MLLKPLKRITSAPARAVLAAAALAALSGCHPDMWDQPRYKPYRPSEFFKDGMSMRQPVEGTVAYGGKARPWISAVYENLSGGQMHAPLMTDEVFHTGRKDGAELDGNYFEVSMELLERGRQRYEITCMPCHGFTGEGDGVIVERGFPRPVSYHIDRLREAGDGYYFDVITNGYGRMYSYASRVAPEDRWAIAAYIRALQHSQNIDLADPSSEMAALHAAGAAEQQAALEAAAKKKSHGYGHDDSHGAEDHGGAGGAGEAVDNDAEQTTDAQ